MIYLSENIAPALVKLGNKFLRVGILAILTLSINAQDVHFTMFNSAPLFINPSNTGNFNGDWRVAGNFRNQWSALSTPYNSATVSFDKQFYVLNQNIAGGLIFVNDNAGLPGLSFNKLYASLGYGHYLKNNHLRYGLQIGYVHGGFDKNQTRPGQWDDVQGIYNNTILEDGSTLSYLDINFGATWKKSINIFEPEVGITLSHLNNPKKSFYGFNHRLPIRFSLNSQVKTRLSDALYVMPSLFFSNHYNANETILGTHLGWNVYGNFSNVREIKGGVYVRNGLAGNIDALAITAGTMIGRLEINISYDLNISKLSQATNNQGAYEISFIYQGISTVLNSYSIPCDRF